MPSATLDDGATSTPRDAARQSLGGSVPVTKKSPLTPEELSADEELRQRTRTFDYLWRSGVAGGLAGCAAKTIVAPLDRVKILFQASNPQYAKYSGSWAGVAATLKDIYHHDGPTGLFRGHSATLLRIFPYAAVKVLAYEQVRSVLIAHKSQETHFRRFLSGSLAGVASVFCTYPLELIRVRMAFETKRLDRSSFIDVCKQIYGERSSINAPGSIAASNPASVTSDAAPALATRGGIINFYRGFSPTVIGMLPYAGMSFLVHDTVGDILRHHSLAKWTTLPRRKNTPRGKAVPLRSWAELTSGGIAGMIAQTMSYPMEIIRRRMQVGAVTGDGHRMRILETAGIIFREKGVPGFYVGLTIGYVKVIPMVAVSFYVYERAKGWFGI